MVTADLFDQRYAITSPGTFAVTPSTPGDAEQIEVRALLIQTNNVVGSAAICRRDIQPLLRNLREFQSLPAQTSKIRYGGF